MNLGQLSYIYLFTRPIMLLFDKCWLQLLQSVKHNSKSTFKWNTRLVKNPRSTVYRVISVLKHRYLVTRLELGQFLWVAIFIYIIASYLDKGTHTKILDWENFLAGINFSGYSTKEQIYSYKCILIATSQHGYE